MLNIFEFSHVKESVELDWFMRKLFMKHPIMCLDQEDKTKLVSDYFSYFSEFS